MDGTLAPPGHRKGVLSLLHASLAKLPFIGGVSGVPPLVKGTVVVVLIGHNLRTSFHGPFASK